MNEKETILNRGNGDSLDISLFEKIENKNNPIIENIEEFNVNIFKILAMTFLYLEPKKDNIKGYHSIIDNTFIVDDKYKCHSLKSDNYFEILGINRAFNNLSASESGQSMTLKLKDMEGFVYSSVDGFLYIQEKPVGTFGGKYFDKDEKDKLSILNLNGKELLKQNGRLIYTNIGKNILKDYPEIRDFEKVTINGKDLILAEFFMRNESENYKDKYLFIDENGKSVLENKKKFKKFEKIELFGKKLIKIIYNTGKGIASKIIDENGKNFFKNFPDSIEKILSIHVDGLEIIIFDHKGETYFLDKNGESVMDLFGDTVDFIYGEGATPGFDIEPGDTSCYNNKRLIIFTYKNKNYCFHEDGRNILKNFPSGEVVGMHSVNFSLEVLKIQYNGNKEDFINLDSQIMISRSPEYPFYLKE